MKTELIKINKSHLIRWLFTFVSEDKELLRHIIEDLDINLGNPYEKYEFNLTFISTEIKDTLDIEIYNYESEDLNQKLKSPCQLHFYFNADVLIKVHLSLESFEVTIF